MKAEADREELINLLKEKIEQIKLEKPKAVLKELEMWMAQNYNVKIANVVEIFNGKTQLEIIPDHLLFKLTKGFHDVLINRWQDFDVSTLSVTKYFTDKNIEDYDKKIIEEEYTSDLVFDEWHKVNDIYSTKISLDDLVYKLRDNNRVRYNPRSQRDLIVVYRNNIPIKKVDINELSIKNMRKLIRNGVFFNPTITLNLNTDENTRSSQLLRIERGKLIIPADAIIDIIDGFHTFTAFTEEKDNNKELKYDININIAMLDYEGANQYILQMDNKNHLTTRQVKRINGESEENFIINRLNRNSSFHFKGKLSNESENFEIVRDYLEVLFNLDSENREKSIKIYNVLLDNLNELIEKNSLYSIKFTKEEWFIYLYLIKKCYEEDISFSHIINYLNIETTVGTNMKILLNKIKYKNKPSKNHIETLDNLVNEVKNNVL